MKRKFYIILTVFTISTVVLLNSNNLQAMGSFVKAVLFNSNIIIDNKLITVEQNSPPILNYNNRVYVPLRFIGNYMNANASYDSETKNLYIDKNHGFYSKSKENKTVYQKDFELRLSTEKTKYSYGEPLKIWSTLIYRGDTATKIIHGGQELSYSITDEEGYTESETITLKKVTETVTPDSDILYLYPSTLSEMYLMNKNKVEDPYKYLDNTLRPSMLPKGTYKIRVSTHFDIDSKADQIDDQVLLTSEIEITIE